MQAFAHPFRFQGYKIVKVDTESDAYAAQMVAAAVQTGKGELPLNGSFGTDSPEFGAIDYSGLIYTITAFHPEITVTAVTQEVDPVTEVVKVRVAFSRSE